MKNKQYYCTLSSRFEKKLFVVFLLQNKELAISLKEVMGRIGIQMVGGFVGYSIMQHYWNLSLTPKHVWRSYYTSSQGNCLTYLNVGNATGALIGQF